MRGFCLNWEIRLRYQGERDVSQSAVLVVSAKREIGNGRFPDPVQLGNQLRKQRFARLMISVIVLSS
jgi:hypothetical protein